MIEPCQQHGEDAGEKDAVEGAGAADRRNRRAKTLHLVEIGEVGTDQNIKFTDRTRCLSIRNRASGFRGRDENSGVSNGAAELQAIFSAADYWCCQSFGDRIHPPLTMGSHRIR